MISLIICSREAKLLAQVKDNIAATIGVAFELIAIDNSEGRYGICEAYNLGAAQAQYEFLCFMHEDIKFLTSNWGQRVATLLADNTIGVVGIAGSTWQLKVPAAWWFSGEQQIRMNIVHTAPGTMPVYDCINPLQASLEDASVLDGVWLCSRRQVWQQYPFDQATFPAFHFYDIDYCTAIYFHYRICVAFDILLEHSSTGKVNDAWLLSAQRYQKKWAAKLPFGPAAISAIENKRLERAALITFLHSLLNSGLPFLFRLRYVITIFKYRPINYDNLWYVKKLLLKNIK